jgi:hypothetical protein
MLLLYARQGDYNEHSHICNACCCCLFAPQGYNNDLSAAASVDEGLERVLSPEGAAASAMVEVPPVTAATFKEQLGLAGEELLAAGMAGLVKDVDTLLPYFASRTSGTE